jgi:hypothetical protein
MSLGSGRGLAVPSPDAFTLAAVPYKNLSRSWEPRKWLRNRAGVNGAAACCAAATSSGSRIGRSSSPESFGVRGNPDRLSGQRTGPAPVRRALLSMSAWTRSGVRSRASGARKLRPPTGTNPPIRPCGGILLGTLLRNPREQSTDFGLPVAPVSPQRAD